MEVHRIIIADNQALTAFAVEKIVLDIAPEVKVEYIPNSYELTKAIQYSDEMTAIVLDYTLFDFADQQQLTLLADSTREKTFWLLISDDLTADFLRFVLYNSENIGVAYKDAALFILREALRYTIHGERYISQHATDILLRKVAVEEHHKDDLTETEREVLKLIAKGKTTKEIAAERFSSIHTINSHRKNIFRKLNVNCAHDAIKYALRSGLVDGAEFCI